MFSYLTFPKVSEQNIYYCRQKREETDTVSMVSNQVSHALNIQTKVKYSLINSTHFTIIVS